VSGRLQDRVIAVAGVGGGLGPVVARALHAEGAIVGGNDRDRGRLDAVEAELGADRFSGHQCDLLDEAQAQNWCAQIVERFGRVDGLLHLVGGWRGGQPIDEFPLEDWDWLHGLLIRTVQHTTRAFRPELVKSEHGRFALVSAAAAQKPTHTNAAYAAAKAAAEAWTLALAHSFEDTDATANVVVVEAIVTPQMRAENPDKKYKKMVEADELAETLVYVCSDAARKMNGQRLELHP
jgi:NAD(P)-dependent dehydrogenase (short-subunit alcohol dehydrogenase family)